MRVKFSRVSNVSLKYLQERHARIQFKMTGYRKGWIILIILFCRTQQLHMNYTILNN